MDNYRFRDYLRDKYEQTSTVYRDNFSFTDWLSAMKVDALKKMMVAYKKYSKI